MKLDSVSTKDSGKYFLEFVSDGCVLIDSININVSKSAEFKVKAPDQVCEGSIARLVFTEFDSDLQQFIINYYGGTVTTSGSNNVSAGFGGLKISNDNIFKIKHLGEGSCYVEKTLILNVLPFDKCKEIEFINLEKQYCDSKDQTIDFKVSGGFNANETYYLYSTDYAGKKNILLDSTKTSNFVIQANKGDNYYYRYLLIESKTDKIQSRVNYLYNNSPYASLNHKVNNVCSGFNIPLNIVKSFSGNLDNIQWKLNGKIIENANLLEYQASETGKYSFSADYKGCPVKIYNNDTRIIVGQIRKPTLSEDPSQICNYSSYNLKAYYSELNEIFDFQWLKDGKELPNQNSLNINLTEAGQYQLKVSQGNCTELSNEFKLIVGEELITPNITSNSYIIKGTNIINICNGLDVSLYLKNGRESNLFDISWEKNGKEMLNQNKSVLNTKEEGTYRLIIKQKECIAFSNSFIVKKSAKSSGIKIQSPGTKVCETDSILIYLSDYNNQLYSLQYQIGADKKLPLYKDGKLYKDLSIYESTYLTESGKYYRLANFKLPNETEGCNFSSDTVYFEVSGKKIIKKLDNSNFLTCNDTINLSFWEYNDFPLSDSTAYRKNTWKYNGFPISDTTININATRSGIYQFTSIDKKGCEIEFSPINIELNKIQVSIIKRDSSQVFCKNSDNYLYANLSYYDKDEKLEWLKDGKIIGNSYSINAKESGKYTLNLTQCTCNASASVDVKVKEIDTKFTPNIDSVSICKGDFVNLIAPKSDAYTWLQNGNSLSVTTQNIKVKDQGKYRVWLEEGGCGIMSKTIEVLHKFLLPTAKISGGGQVTASDSSQVKIDFTSSAPWIFAINNGSEISTEQNPYLFKVKNSSDAVYELKSVKNGCGVGTVSGKATITVVLADEEIEEASILIGPNPASDLLNISVKNSKNSTIQLNIYTTNGKKLTNNLGEKFSKMYENTIDLSDLPASIYFLKVIIDGKINTYKLIKQ